MDSLQCTIKLMETQNSLKGDLETINEPICRKYGFRFKQWLDTSQQH